DADGTVDAGEEDLWRSVWTWTPPTTANPGDEYSLNLDVTDAAATVHAAISGPPPRVIVSPPGEIIFQTNRNGNWDIYSMWADGTHEERLVETPQDETFPSASADGRQICFLRGTSLYVMQTDTSQETLLPVGAVDEAQINPTGQMIAYRRGGEVFVSSTDGSNPTKVADAAPCYMGRVGWSHNGKFVFFDDFNTLKIYCYRIDFDPTTGAITPVKMALEITDPIPTPPQEKVKAATMSLQGNYIYFVVGNITNPYLARLPLSSVDPVNGPVVSGPADKSTSTAINDALVSVSPRGDKVLYCTDQTGSWQIFICDATNWNPRTGMIQLTSTGDNRNPNWIRQRTPLP
ncbi:MAG: PD40 domain-containing protein, partial [Candidatus Eremiobacteraeota bacterium]|nr:PD40 domain-containing protein [Candidatus Eremiobacteraeota bacterium]